MKNRKIEFIDFFMVIFIFMRKKFTLTREVRNSSAMPIGSTVCLSQRTLGQTPNLLNRYFSFINDRPKEKKYREVNQKKKETFGC